jgi:hypothetical protein
MASLRNMSAGRWFLSLFVAILVAVVGFCSVVVGLLEPMPGQYRGPWTNAKLINHRWPIHIVPVPRAKAAELVDYLTLFEWMRMEIVARVVAVLILSLVAFMLTFIAMRQRAATPAI